MSSKTFLLFFFSFLPAEPAFPCGDDKSQDNNNSQVGIWIVNFPGRQGCETGFGLWIFRAGGGEEPDLDC